MNQCTNRQHPVRAAVHAVFHAALDIRARRGRVLNLGAIERQQRLRLCRSGKQASPKAHRTSLRPNSAAPCGTGARPGNEVLQKVAMRMPAVPIWRSEGKDHQWRFGRNGRRSRRSEEHTSELQSLMRISYAVFCLKKKKNKCTKQQTVL